MTMTALLILSLNISGRTVTFLTDYQPLSTGANVLNVFIDIQTSKELIQMDTDKMMTYGANASN